MLVSITSTTPDATELGWLLHKHPDRVRSVDVAFGRAHVFYPEASPERCTATLLVDVDPVALTRGRDGGPAGLEPYVNDRPYAASSMLSVALGRLYGSALAGSCPERPELVDRPLDLEIALPAVPVRGGAEVVRRLFEPLGYQVTCAPIALDPRFPRWGDSRYLALELRGRHPVQRALEHLFVLLPVLDDRKHYWIGSDEIDKLLRRGGAWLGGHPDRELITRRYLRTGSLVRQALARLADDEAADPDLADRVSDEAEAEVERPLSLNEQRLRAVTAAVVAAGGGRVVDLGCGEGRLLQRLVRESAVTHVLGVDVSMAALERAGRRLGLDEASERRRERVQLAQGALTYRDERLAGFDVATVVEVIEHLDPDRLDAFAQALFGHAAPATVIVTTPNREYNVHFDRPDPTRLRHGDHRFEWTRAELAAWCASITGRFGYDVELAPIGPDDPVTGPPTQIAVFRRGRPHGHPRQPHGAAA